MVSIQSTHRRRFDISILPDGNIQVTIKMTGSERYIATIVFTPEEWKKIYAVQETSTS